MPLRLYDTYTRSLRDFQPLHPPEVGVYACGLTVYDYAHIGNLRTYLSEDILRRVLEFNGYTVSHVMNVTDVGHKVLGLRLSEWQPAEEVVPDEIAALIRQRQQARAEKRWRDADTLRDQITAAGYEIEDTPQGPRVKTHRRLK